MSKDYFQDIVPSDPREPKRSPKRVKVADDAPAQPERGIRNISIPQRNARQPVGDVRNGPARRPAKTRRFLWILSGVCVLLLALFLILLFFRSTSVTVVPQSQVVTFDATSQFTAYPTQVAPSGTLSYSVLSTDLTSSQSVPASGTQHVETKASGTITVLNDYSASPIKLIKNTRFQTANGLIFRAPADISIPGKSGGTPGKVQVTVIADKTGDTYNIGPQERFTVPGLQSSPAEYKGVYAMSTASTTGGFSGDQPGASSSDLDAARTQLRADLQQKANAFAAAQNASTTVSLASRVTFTDMPNSVGTNNMVQVNESAHVDVAIAPEGLFASTIGQTVAADVATDTLTLIPQSGFGVTVTSTSAQWGSDPITFTLSGHAMLVWTVDAQKLAIALAGKSQDAFQGIVSSFPGVQSAHARIEPFWESRFPTSPGDIRVTVENPAVSQ
jgi:hypothetical protein